MWYNQLSLLPVMLAFCIEVPVEILALLLPIYFSGNVSKITADGGPNTWTPATKEVQMEFQASGFSLVEPWLL